MISKELQESLEAGWSVGSYFRIFSAHTGARVADCYGNEELATLIAALPDFVKAARAQREGAPTAIVANLSAIALRKAGLEDRTDELGWTVWHL